MYLLDIIPLTNLPRSESQIMSYYHDDSLINGSLVEIDLNHSLIYGLVVNCTPLKNAKTFLKSTKYTLKKIKKVIFKKQWLSPFFLELLKFTADYYFENLTWTTKIILPNNLKSLTKFLSQDKNDIVPPNKQTLIACPTEAHLDFILEKLKQTEDPESIAIIPKKITQKKFNKLWLNILNGNVKTIVGLRSIPFYPFINLEKIIIVDKDNPSYKSWDQHPYYNTEIILKWIANKLKIPLEYNNFETKIETNPKTDIFIYNPYLQSPRKTKYISYLLQQEILKTINKKEQVILFLNRKGWARSIVCEDCGHVFKCTNCDIPLVFHKEIKANLLTCHHCDQEIFAPSICPVCQGNNLNMLGLGIERLEEELKKIKTETPLTFKKVDSELEPEKIKEIIDDFNNHKFDILLGTEIILRPQLKPVSLVSVVSIDALFTFPDFQQEEKILKYLINLKNKSLNQFIIQTIFKDQNVFQVIRNDNIKDFLKQNLEIKKHYNWPPYAQLIKLTFRHFNQRKAEIETNNIFKTLSNWLNKHKIYQEYLTVLPPTPSFLQKVDNLYSWNILIKLNIKDKKGITYKDLKIRNQLLKLVPENWKIDVDPLESI